MHPSFDTWTSIFLLSAGQGIFLSALIFSARTRINLLLGGVMLAYSLSLIYNVLFWTNYYQIFPHYIHILYGMSYLIGPLFYAYIRSDRKNTRLHRWEFLPFLLVAIYQSFLPLYPKENLRQIFAVQDLIQNLHLLVYLTLTLRWWKQLRKNSSPKVFAYKSKVVGAFAGYTLCFFAYYLIYYMGTLVLCMDYLISLMSSIFIYYIGYIAIKQPNVLFDRESPQSRYDRSGITTEAATSLLQELDELIDQKQLYLNGALRLNDIAQSLQVSQHHISQALNTYRETSFSDYINQKRLEHAKRMLQDAQFDELRINEIVTRSGFNNKTTFNSLFKKHTGKSPSAFRKAAKIN